MIKGSKFKMLGGLKKFWVVWFFPFYCTIYLVSYCCSVIVVPPFPNALPCPAPHSHSQSPSHWLCCESSICVLWLVPPPSFYRQNYMEIQYKKNFTAWISFLAIIINIIISTSWLLLQIILLFRRSGHLQKDSLRVSNSSRHTTGRQPRVWAGQEKGDFGLVSWGEREFFQQTRL